MRHLFPYAAPRLMLRRTMRSRGGALLTLEDAGRAAHQQRTLSEASHADRSRCFSRSGRLGSIGSLIWRPDDVTQTLQHRAASLFGKIRRQLGPPKRASSAAWPGSTRDNHYEDRDGRHDADHQNGRDDHANLNGGRDLHVQRPCS